MSKEQTDQFAIVYSDWESKAFFAGVISAAGIEITSYGVRLKTINEIMEALNSTGLQFEAVGMNVYDRTLNLKAAGSKDLPLRIGHKNGKSGVYLPFEGIVSPAVKWLRSIESISEENKVILNFGDHPKDPKGEDTLAYEYTRSFSVRYYAK